MRRPAPNSAPLFSTISETLEIEGRRR